MSTEISKENFARLVQQHAPQVLDFTARLLSDRREAEEVAQDAFVKAFRQLSSFRGDSSFVTWVQRIAYHEAIDHLRQRAPYMVDISEVAAISDDEELSTGRDCNATLCPTVREERILLMEETIDELPPDDQLLLHLYYYEDQPLRDIAYIMDAEPNALAQRLHRIRKRLLRMIKQKEDERTER